MKALSFITLSLLSTTIAQGASLEEHWAAQRTEEITPVKIEGHSVFASFSNIARLCQSLGYHRVVDYKLVACEGNEVLADFLLTGEMALVKKGFEPLQCTMHRKKIETLTCAK